MGPTIPILLMIHKHTIHFKIMCLIPMLTYIQEEEEESIDSLTSVNLHNVAGILQILPYFIITNILIPMVEMQETRLEETAGSYSQQDGINGIHRAIHPREWSILLDHCYKISYRKHSSCSVYSRVVWSSVNSQVCKSTGTILEMPDQLGQELQHAQYLEKILLTFSQSVLPSLWSPEDNHL